MNHHNLYSIDDAARQLAVSKALIYKFIKLGLVIPAEKDMVKPKLTPYGLRRLMDIVDLYEKSYSTESIEAMLNR
jgi:hypothetical protein